MSEITIPAHLLPDPAKLELLADMLDPEVIPTEELPDLLARIRAIGAAEDGETEAHEDLRKWATTLREFGVDGELKRTCRKINGRLTKTDDPGE